MTDELLQRSATRNLSGNSVVGSHSTHVPVGSLIFNNLRLFVGAKKARIARGEPTWPSKRLKTKKLDVGGEGGIRTLQVPMESVSYRNHIAAFARNAGDAVAPLPAIARWARRNSTIPSLLQLL